MIRRVIEIDESKCNGCEICVDACHEGAITMVNGKATLLRDDYCDGLGDCLPTCPTNAISFIVREADDFDKEAVEENMRRKAEASSGKIISPKTNAFTGCPGSQASIISRIGCPSTKIIDRNQEEKFDNSSKDLKELSKVSRTETKNERYTTSDSNLHLEGVQVESISMLRQWPVQIKLVPVNASYFKGAKLLIAADCVAYAYASFHNEFIKDHITLIGCPKLDSIDYSEKLTQILINNEIESLVIVRMEVPCCGGLEQAVRNALKNSGKIIPWQVAIITTDGQRMG